MDPKELFEAIIDHYGDENIIGFKFDNANRKMFTKSEPFDRSIHYIPEIESLQFEEKDMKGTVIRVTVPVFNVQGVITAKDESSWKVDKRWSAW